ncbi:MAG: hypothetical protein M1820_010385 [Bogoriella megaspora]|nr:MAG: hypothetical protein M1820_010385 [Bogoriella megaspora]
MAVQALIPFLVAMMLLTGVCNTLLTKFQDLQCVRHCDDPDPSKHAHFEQPVIQTAQMFIGEMGCWLVVGGVWLFNRYYTKTNGNSEAAYAPISDASTAVDTPEPEVNDNNQAGDEEEGNGMDGGAPTKVEDEGRLPLTGWRTMLLALPATCDIAGTTLMNVGLLFVAASIYQMTRGALVLFVGLFSVVFLKRKLGWYKWFALFVVVLGVALVGLAGIVEGDGKVPDISDGKSDGHALMIMGKNIELKHVASTLVKRAGEVATDSAVLNTLIGIMMIAGGQVFTATQFVAEESIMEKYALQPLKVVGWEGIFGFLVTVIGMIILHFAVGRTEKGRYGYFDANEGLREVGENRTIVMTSILIMISIGGFNAFGLAITRNISATARSVIDTCRTLFIWIVSLGLGWESFKWLQLLGFAVLVYGTFLFNDLIRPPLQKYWSRPAKSTTEALLPEAPPPEHT